MLSQRMPRLIAVLAASAIAVMAFAASASAYSPGTQKNYKVLAVIAHFQDDPPSPVSAAQVKAQLFTASDSVHEWLKANSLGTTGLTGVVNADGDAVRIEIARNRNGQCVTDAALKTELMVSAAASGFAEQNYDRHFYIDLNCSQSTGASGTTIDIMGGSVSNTSAYAHEFGHTLFGGGATTMHAGVLTCSMADGVPVPIGPECDRWESGDLGDPMGTQYHLMSLVNRIRLGFFPATANTVAVAEQTYDIYTSAESPVSGRTYNLQIPMRMPGFRSMTYPTFSPLWRMDGKLNLEYRQTSGAWEDFSGDPAGTNGAALRFSTSTSPYESYRLDTDRHTRPYLDQVKLMGLPWYQDYYYSTDQGAPEVLSTDSGYYSPQDDILLSVPAAPTTQKVQVKYSKGLLSAEQTQVQVSNRRLTVTARGGYANDFHIRRQADGTITIRDGNAPIAAGNDCSRIEKNVVSCPAGAFDRIWVNAGDRRDYVDISTGSMAVQVTGGDGDDVLIGGPQPDQISGDNGSDLVITGAGDDIVSPGGGMDELSLGDGDDVALGSDIEADEYQCGAGYDTVQTDTADPGPDPDCESVNGLETVFTSGAPDDARIPLGATLTYVASSPRAGAVFECRVDGDPFASCAASNSPPTDVVGVHTFEIRAVDAGSSDATPAARRYEVTTADITAPAVTILAPSGNIAASAITPQFTANGATTTVCAVDSNPAATCQSGVQLAASATGALPDGEHSFTLTATDAAGNTSTSTTRFSEDRTAPAIGFEMNGPFPFPSPSLNLWFVNVGETQQPVETDRYTRIACVIDNDAPVPCANGSLLPAKSDGTHVLRATAYDRAGNASTAADVNYTVDTSLPFSDIATGPAEGSTVTGTSQSFTFNSVPLGASRAECKFDSGAWIACPVGGVTWRNLSRGNHTFSLRRIADDGYVDPTPKVRKFKVSP